MDKSEELLKEKLRKKKELEQQIAGLDEEIKFISEIIKTPVKKNTTTVKEEVLDLIEIDDQSIPYNSELQWNTSIGEVETQKFEPQKVKKTKYSDLDVNSTEVLAMIRKKKHFKVLTSEEYKEKRTQKVMKIYQDNLPVIEDSLNEYLLEKTN